MVTQIIGMYGLIAGDTQDALASIDVPQDGFITGVDWDVSADMDADSEALQIELSFIASNQVNINDVRGRLSGVSAEISLTTSGIASTSIQKFVGPMDVPVAGGERLHLHSVASSGVTGAIRCNVHLDSARAPTRRSARRR